MSRDLCSRCGVRAEPCRHHARGEACPYAPTRSLAFVGQLSEARGRWVCACSKLGHYAFPRNAWSDEACSVIMARRA